MLTERTVDPELREDDDEDAIGAKSSLIEQRKDNQVVVLFWGKARTWFVYSFLLSMRFSKRNRGLAKMGEIWQMGESPRLDAMITLSVKQSSRRKEVERDYKRALSNMETPEESQKRAVSEA